MTERLPIEPDADWRLQHIWDAVDLEVRARRDSISLENGAVSPEMLAIGTDRLRQILELLNSPSVKEDASSANIEATVPPPKQSKRRRENLITIDHHFWKCFASYKTFAPFIQKCSERQRLQMLESVMQIPHFERTKAQARGICLLVLMCLKLEEAPAKKILKRKQSVHRGDAASEAIGRTIDQLSPADAICQASEILWDVLSVPKLLEEHLRLLSVVSKAFSVNDASSATAQSVASQQSTTNTPQ